MNFKKSKSDTATSDLTNIFVSATFQELVRPYYSS
jgi:hypothetical protein